MWVIEDWIRKHKDEPTPNPSQEGNLEKGVSLEGNMKRDVSQEGNKKAAGDSSEVNNYTPVPSQEMNKESLIPGGKTGVGANKDGEL